MLVDAAPVAVSRPRLNKLTVPGDVLTGVIRLDDVPVLAALPEVIRIEASSPIFVEKPTHSGSLPAE